MQNIFNYKLRNSPFSVKVLCAGYLMALGLAYIYALANIAMVVGLTPKEIAIHYYGSAEVEKAATAEAGEQSLDLSALDSESAPARPKPSLKNLVAEGHFHHFWNDLLLFWPNSYGTLYVALRKLEGRRRWFALHRCDH